MEIPSIQGFGTEQSLVPLEKPLALKERQRTLRIGVPKEVSGEERRVALAPYGAGILAGIGHEVAVERGAGKDAHFTDSEYAEAGAEVVDSADELYARSELIVKVFPPTDEELGFMQEKQTLISALHLGNTTPDFLRRLMDLRVTGIGFEFISERDGTFPIVRMMHEISGSMAIQVAARLLESTQGGRGVMLGGISGVPPSTVVILGAGVVGVMGEAQVRFRHSHRGAFADAALVGADGGDARGGIMREVALGQLGRRVVGVAGARRARLGGYPRGLG